MCKQMYAQGIHSVSGWQQQGLYLLVQQNWLHRYFAGFIDAPDVLCGAIRGADLCQASTCRLQRSGYIEQHCCAGMQLFASNACVSSAKVHRNAHDSVAGMARCASDTILSCLKSHTGTYREREHW